LLLQVRASAKQRKIRLEQVFFGGEDYPSYAQNFLRRLRQEQFLVVRVTAWEAKQQRSNFQVSSNSPDLLDNARYVVLKRWVKSGTMIRKICAKPVSDWRRKARTRSLRWLNDWCA
jgi:hypothetical protein